MGLPTNVAFELWPAVEVFPHARVLDEFMATKFDRAACERALERLVQADVISAAALRSRGLNHDDFVLADDVIWPAEPQTWMFEVSRGGGERERVRVEVERDQLETVAAILKATATGDATADMWDFLDSASLMSSIAPTHPATRRERRGWAPFEGPGLQRREHASILFASASTRVLLDPIFATGGLPNIDTAPTSVGEQLDALLITHGHGDHWHLPSMFAAAGEDTVTVVPRAPKRSFMCSSLFAADLRAFGFEARDPVWHETVRVGDVEIDVLPFYGEQPAVDERVIDADVRNWGNCYRINAPDLSILVLVDSGTDPLGSMMAVAEETRRRRGPPDIVLACLREFACPFFGGLSPYWAALTFAQNASLYRRYTAGSLPFVTAGLAGIADICQACDARYFMPYAHGFTRVGAPIADIGWGLGEPAEADVLTRLDALFAERKLRTRCRSWQNGDVVGLRGGELRVRGATA